MTQFMITLDGALCAVPPEVTLEGVKVINA